MSVENLFRLDSILIDLHVTSMKQLFQDIAGSIIDNSASVSAKLSERDIISAALERERLGSTGVGNGVAIPHARAEGITEIVTVFARLAAPIDFRSVDDRPVDLVVFLLAPKDAGNAHLRALARVSRLLRSQDMRRQLRDAPTNEAIYALISDTERASAA